MTTQAPCARAEDPRLLPLRGAPQRRLAGTPRSARGSAAAAAGSWAGDPASVLEKAGGSSGRAEGGARGWGRVCSPRVLAPRFGPKANIATFSSPTQRPGDSAPSNTSGDAFSSQRPGPQLGNVAASEQFLREGGLVKMSRRLVLIFGNRIPRVGTKAHTCPVGLPAGPRPDILGLGNF